LHRIDSQRSGVKACSVAQVAVDGGLAWIRAAQGIGGEKEIEVVEWLRATPHRRTGDVAAYGVRGHVISDIKVVARLFKSVWYGGFSQERPYQEQCETPPTPPIGHARTPYDVQFSKARQRYARFEDRALIDRKTVE
jgi:hypothetical protein